MAELQRTVAGLAGILASGESDVAKTPASEAPVAEPAAKPASKNSDPALTRAERKVKLLGGGIAAMAALVSLLITMLAFAWSYIKGYGDDRAARAVEIEESRNARTQLDDHETRLTQFVLEQKSLVETIASVQGELADLRRYRELHRLEAEYLTQVNDAITHKHKVPAKGYELVAAEVAAGIHAKTPP